MNTSRISVRYAKALFETALEQNKAEKINTDMRLISQAVVSPEFKDFLENPVIFPSKKQAIFNEIFKGKIDALSFDFFKLLTDNKREYFLKAIARNYGDLYRDKFGIKSVDLLTAFKADKKLTDEVGKIIAKKFESKVEMTDRTDPDIIGGFVLTVDGLQYDASVSGKLKDIRKELL
jgi:F-type H+-transporting ATPase subunit delta